MEPFSSTKEQGMGVGLSLSCAIAQHHGGSLALAPDAYHTRFQLLLPLRAAQFDPLPDGSLTGSAPCN